MTIPFFSSLFFSQQGAPPLIVDAVDFDGINDYFNKSTPWTGAIDSSQGILSLWFRLDGGDGSRRVLFSSRDTVGGNNILQVERDASNKIVLTLEGGGIAASITSTSNYTVASGGIHVLASWSTNFTAGNKLLKLVINGVSQGTIADSGAAFTGPWAAASQEHRLAEQFNGNNNFDGSLAEFYLNISTYLDVTQANVMGKFRTVAGKPANIGTTGSTPTGSTPMVYLSVRPGGVVADFAVNRGSGGNMTVNGSPAISSWSPSD